MEEVGLPPPRSRTDDDEISSKHLTKVCQQLTLGTADLVNGQIQTMYENGDFNKYDNNQCGTIVAPRSNIKERTESTLAAIEFIKMIKAPDGVLFDTTKISRSYSGTYEEGKHYDVLDRVLGSGLHGDVVAVRDKKKESDHALKTVMLASFKTDEVQCWTDLEGEDHFPSLYMFSRQNKVIKFHFEILDKAVTMNEIIEKHMLKLTENQQLLRHFSLYVLHGLLEASTVMHSKGWLHNDLHDRNVMLQPTPDAKLKVCVVDFGTATKLDKTTPITKDIREIIRVFTSVFVNDRFKNAFDLKNNWEKNLEEGAENQQLSKEYKNELLNIVKIAMDVNLTEDAIRLKELVDGKLKNSLEKTPDIMKTICGLIFPPNDMQTDSTDSVAGCSIIDFLFEDVFKIG